MALRCGLSPLDSACATAFSPRRDLAPDSLVDLCTGEISWDSLGPSSTDNLAGLYYPTASLLKEMPDEACKIVADAAKRCPASATLILTPCGGAAADVPKDATAVYHRDALCGNQPVN